MFTNLMNDKKQLKGHLLSILCVIAWGTSFLVSKNLMNKLTPVQLMLLRFIIAWLAIWITVILISTIPGSPNLS